MTRHYKDLGSAFDSLEVGGGGGRKKRRREEKTEIGERRKGTPAIVTSFCSPMRTRRPQILIALIRQ